MPTITKFEDMPLWQKARLLNQMLRPAILRMKQAREWGLNDQVSRSAGSIMDNIAEGFERGGNREFITFLGYAKGSNGEFRCQLYRMRDAEYLDEAEFQTLYELSDEITRMLIGFIRYLKSSDFKGYRLSEPEAPYGSNLEVPDELFSPPNPE